MLSKGKEEVGVVQNELEETTRINQQLEGQKKELQSRIEEVNNQVNVLLIVTYVLYLVIYSM